MRLPRFYEQFSAEPGWKVLATEHGHHLMLDDPAACAAILLDAV